MAKVYREKPKEGDIAKAIKNLDGKGKSDYKCGLLSSLNIGTYSYYGFQVTVHTASFNGKLLTAIVSATKDGTPVNVGDGIFEYWNPPVKDGEGTYHKEIFDGTEVDVENNVENPIDTFKRIIGQTVALKYYR